MKICCIASAQEARLAIDAGASAIGLVSTMPSGPGVIEEMMIAEIAATIPPGIGSFLLTSIQDASGIIEQQRRCKTNTIQICDRLVSGSFSDLRAALPGIGIVQVVHVSGNGSLEEAKDAAPHVDAILLDSGNRNAPQKELGGTGRVHNWEISRRIVENLQIPVYLAGGLKAENVEEAIRLVRPFGVDVCSGVRTDGMLDRQKLRALIDTVRIAPVASCKKRLQM
jgi:phosphoribosylanthranilate isomerase